MLQTVNEKKKEKEKRESENKNQIIIYVPSNWNDGCCGLS